jgi:ElaB/YqjD/DUF883 family membrane-anchored ribosome-binding protein
MLGFSMHSGSKFAKSSEIEQRLRSIEQHLGRVVPARTNELADHMAESVTSALSTMATRFLGSANMNVQNAGNIAGAVSQLGSDAARRVARGIKHHPLATVAVVVSVGIFAGVIGHRR